jgi:phosphopantetheinyl transferase (holo-ACP synthase)
VGNDIVDLKTPEAMGKSADTRFINRVLTPCEQRMIRHSEHPDTLVWALWAAKETAFKAIRKSSPDVTSAPRRYPVRYLVRYLVKFNSDKISSSLYGVVDTLHGNVPVKMFITEEYVHCIGIAGPANRLESITYGMDRIRMDQRNTRIMPGSESVSKQESAAVRRLAKKDIASSLQLKEQDIQIVRHKTHNRLNPPMVYAKGRMKNMEISLSHDGRFAAYAYLADL